MAVLGGVDTVRKVLVAVVILAASCSGQGEVIPTPSPASNPTTSTPEINSTVLVAAEETTTTTELESTTTVVTIRVRATTTTEYLQPVATKVQRSTSSTLASIRACESGGDYTTDTGNGYYGAYQFSWGTWASVGGTGNPAHASPAEQDMRAQVMIDSGRRGEWPNC